MKLSNLKIFYFGTSDFSKRVLEHLVENNIAINYVITRPDMPTGRNKQITVCPVKKYSQEKNIKIKQFHKIDDAALDFFIKERPDLVIVVSYGLILPKKLIDLPKYGCVNIHGSLLPYLRGPSPIQTSLLKGARTTGTTIMLMDEKVDSGDILAFRRIMIDKSDTCPQLEKKLVTAANNILIPVLESWVNKKIAPRKQDHGKATFTKILTKNDGKVSWANSAQEIFNQYRAYYNWPKIHSLWESSQKETIKKLTFHEISIDPDTDNKEKKMGEVFVTKDNKIAIQTLKGIVLPLVIQMEGKNKTDIRSFVNGYPNFVGSCLK